MRAIPPLLLLALCACGSTASSAPDRAASADETQAIADAEAMIAEHGDRLAEEPPAAPAPTKEGEPK